MIANGTKPSPLQCSALKKTLAPMKVTVLGMWIVGNKVQAWNTPFLIETQPPGILIFFRDVLHSNTHLPISRMPSGKITSTMSRLLYAPSGMDVTFESMQI